MLFPKEKKKKKAKQKRTPILNDRCFFSGRTDWLECHHIFGGSNREKSEQYGLKVWLNHYWHNEPPNGVHHNKRNMLILHQYGQKVFEDRYPDIDFCKEFQCENYLNMSIDE